MAPDTRTPAELQNRLREVFNLRIPVEEVPPGTLERFEMKSKRWRKCF